MHKPEVVLKQVVGKFFDAQSGKMRRAGWDMDLLMLNGRQIATINRVPGAPIALLAGVLLSAEERKAVEDAVAYERGGIKPRSIRGPVQLPFELLSDEEGDDTDVDEESDE